MSLEDDVHLENVAQTMAMCASNSTRQAVWNSWHAWKRDRERNATATPLPIV